MSKLFSLATLAAMMLAACGGSDSFSSDTGSGGNGNGGGNGGGSTPDDTVRIGSGTGDDFQPGVIAVSQSELSAGGSASLTVTFVDSTNILVGDSIDVSFTSPCVAGSLANIVESQVTTVTGSATSTYSATGCSGDDQIRASANVNGVVLQASATVTVEPATVGSMKFVSAEPTNIGLLGTGGAGRQETSTVRFRVTDSTGGPVSGATVDFSLNTTVGGIDLTPESVTSDVQGYAQTVVSAGSVATSVRVTAIVNGSAPQIAAQSDQLTITTGIPDDDSMSLSLECTNLEAWNIDGQTTNATIRMSDRFNNPVPDGTAVTLTSEGGQIGGSCQSGAGEDGSAGVCSVTWVSQNPRPANGRVSIIASAIGEESFIDSNSDGRFSSGENETPLGEPYRDDNENGIYDVGVEVFRDFNSNGLRDGPTDANYLGFNGLLCDANCAETETLYVSSSNILVMSSGSAMITDNVGGSITVPPASEASAEFTLTVGDNKGNGTTSQPMAGGTEVSLATSNGSIIAPSSFTVPCSTFDGPLDYTFTIEGDSQSSSGTITATVTSPSGIVTIHNITFND